MVRDDHGSIPAAAAIAAVAAGPGVSPKIECFFYKLRTKSRTKIDMSKDIPPNHLLVEPRYYHSDRSKITLLPWLW